MQVLVVNSDQSPNSSPDQGSPYRKIKCEELNQSINHPVPEGHCVLCSPHNSAMKRTQISPNSHMIKTQLNKRHIR